MVSRYSESDAVIAHTRAVASTQDTIPIQAVLILDTAFQCARSSALVSRLLFSRPLVYCPLVYCPLASLPPSTSRLTTSRLSTSRLSSSRLSSSRASGMHLDSLISRPLRQHVACCRSGQSRPLRPRRTRGRAQQALPAHVRHEQRASVEALGGQGARWRDGWYDGGKALEFEGTARRHTFCCSAACTVLSSRRRT